MQLIERGLVGIDDEVEDGLTVRMLLNQTSGFTQYIRENIFELLEMTDSYASTVSAPVCSLCLRSSFFRRSYRGHLCG